MSQKQNTDCSDLVENAANEAKRLKWSQDISSAQFKLKRLQEDWDRKDKEIKNERKRVVYELAENLEKDGMPLEYIVEEVIRGVNGYGMSESTIRRLMKKTKYDLEKAVEESTSQTESLNPNDDNSSTGQSTVTVVGGGPEPEELPPTKAVKQLTAKLAETEQIIQKKDEEIQFLKEAHPVADIPKLVDDKIGAVKVQNLSKVSEFDKRGYQILSSRFGEIIRRKIVGEGKATIRFYILGKDRTTNVEYLVPVSFTVDMMNRSTELVLDESRL